MSSYGSIYSSYKNKPFRVMVAAITGMAFFVNIFAYDLASAAAAAPIESPASQPGESNQVRIAGLAVDSFKLPEYLGYIKDSWQPSNDTTIKPSNHSAIIHIQDAHCNYAAQNTIANIIDYLNREYGINTVNLEGGEDGYYFSPFYNIKDKDLRNKAADYFLKEGEINAAEFYAVNNPGKINLWGVEDTDLYLDNLKVYRDSLKHKNEIDKSLKTISRILASLKVKIYPKELLALDQKTNDFHNKAMELRDYAAYLGMLAKDKNIDTADLKNFDILTKTLLLEKGIDFKRANLERDQLVDDLNKRLSKNEIKELVQKAVEFRMRHIPPAEFYAYLAGKAKEVDIDIAEYKDLTLYIGYINSYSTLKKETAFKEIEALEDGIKEKLYQNKDQRDLNRLGKHLSLIRNLLNITLTQEDYKYYLTHKKEFAIDNFITFIRTAAPKYGLNLALNGDLKNLDSYMRDMERFYELSYKRDEEFVKRLKGLSPAPSLRAPRGRSNLNNAAILITGGFHSENLASLFKKRGISYISIMPNFGLDDKESPYFKLLAGNGSIFHKTITTTASTLALYTHFGKNSPAVYGYDETEECIENVSEALRKGVESTAAEEESPAPSEGPTGAGEVPSGARGEAGRRESASGEPRLITVEGNVGDHGKPKYHYFNAAMLPITTNDGKNGKLRLMARRVEGQYKTSDFHPSDIVLLEASDSDEAMFTEKRVILEVAEDPRIMTIETSNGPILGMTYVRAEKAKDGTMTWHSEFVRLADDGTPIKDSTLILKRPDGKNNKNTYITNFANGKIALIDRPSLDHRSEIHIYAFDSWGDFEDKIKEGVNFWDDYEPLIDDSVDAKETGWSEKPHIGFNTIVDVPGYDSIKIAYIHLARTTKNSKYYATAVLLLKADTLESLGSPVILHDPDDYNFTSGGSVPGVIYEIGAVYVPDGQKDGGRIYSVAGVTDDRLALFRESVADIIERYRSAQPEGVRVKIDNLLGRTGRASTSGANVFEKWARSTSVESIEREVLFLDLIEDIQNSDWYRYEDAARTLGALIESGLIKKEEVAEKLPLDAIIESLGRSDGGHQQAAATTLKILANSGLATKEEIAKRVPVEEIFRTVGSGDWYVRGALFYMLKTIIEAGFVTPEKAREKMSDSTLSAIAGALCNKEALIRYDAAVALEYLTKYGVIKKEEIKAPSLDIIFQSLKGADCSARFTSANTIKSLLKSGLVTKKDVIKNGQIAEALDVITTTLRDSDWQFRKIAADTLKILMESGLVTPEEIKERIPVNDILNDLFNGIKSHDSGVRYHAAAILNILLNAKLITKEEIGKDPPLDRIVDDLNCEFWHARMASAALLKSLVDLEIVSAEEIKKKGYSEGIADGIIEGLIGSEAQVREVFAATLKTLVTSGVVSREEVGKRIDLNFVVGGLQDIDRRVHRASAVVLNTLIEAGITTKEEIRDSIYSGLKDVFPFTQIEHATPAEFDSYYYFFLRLFARLKMNEKARTRIFKYIHPDLLELAKALRKTTLEGPFYEELSKFIRENESVNINKALERLAETLQRLIYEKINSDKSFDMKLAKDLTAAATLLAYLHQHDLSIDFARLKTVFKLINIELMDGGNSRETASILAGEFIRALSPIEPNLLPLPPPRFEPVDSATLPMVNLSDLELDTEIDYTKPDKALGRTLVYRMKEGRYLAVKFLKRSVIWLPDDLRREREDPGRLIYESEFFDYLNELKANGVDLEGVYPHSYPIKGARAVRVKESDIPQEMREALKDGMAAAQKPNEETMPDTAAGYYTVMAYISDTHDYFTYLHEADEGRMEEAVSKNLHDLLVLARYGLIHPDIIELFHNINNAIERVDEGRYVWMIDIIHPMTHRRGAGRLNGWEGGVRYPNLRVSGPADFAEMISVGELVSLSHPHSQYMKNDLQRFGDADRRKVLLAQFMGNYTLAAALDTGKDLKAAGRLDLENPSELSALIKNCYSAAYRAYTGKDDSDIATLVDWDMLARQMAFFMTDAYVEPLRTKSIRSNIFGPNTKIEYSTNLRESRGWIEDRGWVFDGVNPDLGPVNGPNPLQELIKANYIYTMFMVATGPAADNVSRSSASGMSPQEPSHEGIDLSSLIGFLRANTTTLDFDEFFSDPRKLEDAASNFRGRPERLDTIINLQGPYRRQAIVELIANAIDAVMPKDVLNIGRFGIGAFQCLAELEDEGDYAEWISATDNNFAYKITVAKASQPDSYRIRLEKITQGVVKGTTVRLFKKKGCSPEKQEKLIAYVLEKLYLNYRAPIYVNGIKINDAIGSVSFVNGDRLNFISNLPVNVRVGADGYTVVDPGIGMGAETILQKLLIPGRGVKDIPSEELSDEDIRGQTKVFYAPNGSGRANDRKEARVNLQIAGVIIESFRLKGYNLASDVTIELPPSTALTEDRQHVQLTPQALKALNAAISKIMNMKDEKHRIEVINSIAFMLNEISERDERALQALQDAAGQFRSYVREKERDAPGRYLYLPNEEGFFNLEIPHGREVIYVDGVLAPFAPEEFPGIQEVRNHLSTSYRVWAVRFGTDSVSFSCGNDIIVNRGYYEKNRENPAALDLALNPQVTGYEPAGRKPADKIKLLPPQAHLKISPDETEEPAQAVSEEIMDLTGQLDGGAARIVRDEILPLLSELPPETSEKAEDWLRRLIALNKNVRPLPQDAVIAIVRTFRKELLSEVRPEHKLDYPRLKGHKKLKRPSNRGVVSGSALITRGEYKDLLAVSNIEDRSISIIDPNTGEEVKRLRDFNLSVPYDMAALPDGNLAVYNHGDRSISIIDPDALEEVNKLTDLDLPKSSFEYCPPKSITTLPDGNLAVCNIEDRSISIIDLNTGKEVKRLRNLNLAGPQDITTLQDGNLAVSSYGDNSIVIIDPRTGEEVNRLTDLDLAGPQDITTLQDGNLAVGNRGYEPIVIIDPRTGEEVNRLTNLNISGPQDMTTLSDGKLVVYDFADNSINIIEFEEKKVEPLDYTRVKGHRKLKETLNLKSPRYGAVITRGEYKDLLAVYNGGSISIIDPRTGEEVRRLTVLNISNPEGMTALPDGHLAVCDWEIIDKNTQISIIDPRTGEEVKRLTDLNISRPRGMTAMPDGNLAVYDWGYHLKNSSIIIIDPDTGEEVKRLTVLNLDISNSITTLPDGNLAVCYGDANSISIIDPDTGEEVKRLTGLDSDGPSGIATLPDGNLAVCNRADKSITIIEFEKKKTREFLFEPEIPSEDEGKMQERFGEASQFISGNSVLFSKRPGLLINYLFNLFYLPDALKGEEAYFLNVYLVYMGYPALRLVNPELVSETSERLTGSIGQSYNDGFFSLFNDLGMGHLTADDFKGLFTRWLKFHQRLNNENMAEAREIFFAFVRENANLIEEDFDASGVESDFLRLACLYLRGELREILEDGDEEAVQGVISDEAAGFSLGRVNALYNSNPSGVGDVGVLNDYRRLVELVENERGPISSADYDNDIAKRISGQDKSENLFIREDVQNARDAILTERRAAAYLAAYYQRYGADEVMDEGLMRGLIGRDFGDGEIGYLLGRIRILDNIISSKRVENDKTRRDVAEELEGEYNSAAIKIRSYIRRGVDEWIVSVEDPCGMELKTILGPLLVLDETTKIGSFRSEGILGMGFYTNFADCDEARITTGTGQDKFYELIITKDEGSQKFVISALREREGSYKGTIIERVKKFTMAHPPDLDALFVGYGVSRYVSTLQDVAVVYNGKKMNEKLRQLGSVDTEFGRIHLYTSDSRYQRLTRSLLYVEYPKSEEYFALVAEPYLMDLRSRGFTIDLPKGIPLVRTRMTISQKERYLPVVQRAIAALCLKATVRRYVEEGALPPGLSEDYFSDAFGMDRFGTLDQPAKEAGESAAGLGSSIENEARLINENRLEGVNFQRYLIRRDDSDALKELRHRSLKYLITLIRVKDNEGRDFSLADKRKEFLAAIKANHASGRVAELEKITNQLGMQGVSGLEPYLLGSIERLNRGFLTAHSPRETVDTVNNKPLQDFERLTARILDLCGLEEVGIEFYKKEESEIAVFEGGILRWNLYHAQRYVDMLANISDGRITDPMAPYNFYRELLFIIAHEGAHLFDAGKATHESAERLVGLFAWRQKQLLDDFIKRNIGWDELISGVTPHEPPSAERQSSSGAASTSARLEERLAERYEIIDIGTSPELLENQDVIEKIKNGGVVKIRLDFTTDLISVRMRLMRIAAMLDVAFSEEFGLTRYKARGLWYVIGELLKNAFLHGNGLAFTIPIFIRLDVENQTIEVYDSANGKPIDYDERLMQSVDESGLGGDGVGIQNIRENGWKLADDFAVPVTDVFGNRVGNKVTVVRRAATPRVSASGTEEKSTIGQQAQESKTAGYESAADYIGRLDFIDKLDGDLNKPWQIWDMKDLEGKVIAGKRRTRSQHMQIAAEAADLLLLGNTKSFLSLDEYTAITPNVTQTVIHRLNILSPRAKRIFVLSVALHDAGYHLFNEGESHEEKGAVYAERLLKEKEEDIIVCEAVTNLIRGHADLWNLTHGSTEKVRVLKDNILAMWLKSVVDRGLIRLEETEEFINELKTIFAVMALVDIHASGDRHLKDDVADQILKADEARFRLVQRSSATIGGFHSVRGFGQPIRVLVPRVCSSKETTESIVEDREFQKMIQKANSLLEGNGFAGSRVIPFKVIKENLQDTKDFDRAYGEAMRDLPKGVHVFCFVPAAIRKNMQNQKTVHFIQDALIDGEKPDIATRLALAYHLADYLRHPDQTGYVSSRIIELLAKVSELSAEEAGQLREDLKKIFEIDFILKIRPFNIETFKEYRRNVEEVLKAA